MGHSRLVLLQEMRNDYLGFSQNGFQYEIDIPCIAADRTFDDKLEWIVRIICILKKPRNT